MKIAEPSVLVQPLPQEVEEFKDIPDISEELPEVELELPNPEDSQPSHDNSPELWQKYEGGVNQQAVQDANLARLVHQPVEAQLIYPGVPTENKKKGILKVFSDIKSSIVGAVMSEQEKDAMSRIDEQEFELSNSDVILARPGCLIRKTWRIVNISQTTWPSDTRIASVTPGLCHETMDKIYHEVHPNGIVDISVRIFIPDDVPPQNHIFQYIMRLYSDKIGCFGEPIIATVQMDDTEFVKMKDGFLKDPSTHSGMLRVTDYPEDLETYRMAYQSYNNSQGTLTFVTQLKAFKRAAELGVVLQRDI